MPPHPSMNTIRFGPFELDIERQELWRAGVALTVQPQPLRVLTLLISRAGRLVERDELQESLWGIDPLLDTDRGLNHTIRKLRQALRDDPRNPSYIQTVPRRGYRFIAEITPNSVPEAATEPRTIATEVAPAASPEETRPSSIGRGFVVGGELPIDAAPTIRLTVQRFRDITDDRRWPKLADGIREELLTELVSWRNDRLSVVDGEPDSAMAAALGSDDSGPINGYALRGCVRRSGDHVRINVHLIRCRDAVLVGTSVFEDDLGNVFELQARLAQDIASALVRPMVSTPAEGPSDEPVGPTAEREADGTSSPPTDLRDRGPNP